MTNKTWDEILKEAENASDLEELFELWKLAHCVEKKPCETTVSGINSKSFHSDGYIAKEVFGGILFILKEANIQKNDVNITSDQIEWYRRYLEGSGKDNKPKQIEKIGRMACYALNGDREPSEDEIAIALQQSAVMNLNKRGGKRYIDKAKFPRYIKEYSTFIKRQIVLLNPQTIVLIGKDIQNILKGCGISLDGPKMNKIPIIEMWHTSYCMKGVERVDMPGIDKNVATYIDKFISLYDEQPARM